MSRRYRRDLDPTGDLCSRCQRWLPADNFRLQRGRWRSAWCNDCYLANTREWRARNRAALSERRRADYAANLEREHARTRRRHLARPNEARWAGADIRRVDERDWRRLLARWGNACAYCQTSGADLTVDHVIPLSRGGRHAIGNLLPACRSCNSHAKNDQLIVELRYIQEPGFLGMLPVGFPLPSRFARAA